MQSKNAIGNLINRYRAVLKKCHILNTFGTLATPILMASTLFAGALTLPSEAHAFTPTVDTYTETQIKDMMRSITPPAGYDAVSWATYLDSLTFTPSSSYILVPNVTLGSSDYYTTFTTQEKNANGEYIDVNYGIKLDDRYAVGVGDSSGSNTRNRMSVTTTDAIINENFIGNYTTSSGGAIYVYGNSASISSITGNFFRNTSDRTGGAIFALKTTIGSITSDFIENIVEKYSSVADSGGGAITINETAIGSITGNFIRNSAQQNGGAINSYKNSSITTLISDFIDNKAVGSGGAIYNVESTITTLTGNFIRNSTTSDTSNGARGGAIFSDSASHITTLISDFIGNSATGSDGAGGGAASGGALYTSSSINLIMGDFIGNNAIGGNANGNDSLDFGGNSDGGALYNHGTINTLIGDFIGNSVTGGASTNSAGGQASGGGLHNIGTITNLSGDFINNSASATNSISSGGAIYDGGGSGIASIGTISGTFQGNNAKSDSSALGGAIYTNNDLNFLADGKDYSISGNYTARSDNSNKEYNAIYFAADGKALNFDLKNNGSYTLDDTIKTDGKNQYSVIIKSSDASGGTFNLNNELQNASAVTLENASLVFGGATHDSIKYSGKIADNATLTVNGESTLANANLVNNPTTINAGSTTTFKGYTNLGTVEGTGTLNVGNDTTSGNVIFADNVNVTLGSGSSLFVNNGSIDLSNTTFTVDAGASQFEIGADGTLIAQASDFGTINADGSFTKNGTVEKQLTNNGTLELTTGSLAKTSYVKLLNDINWQMLTTNRDNVNLIANLTGLYSLSYFDPNAHSDTDNIMAGTLANASVTAAGIVKNPEESKPTSSSIKSGASLTLTGNNTYRILLEEDSYINAGGNLIYSTLSNSGNLVLGDAAELNETSYLEGNLSTLEGSSTEIHSSIDISGSVTTRGELVFSQSATLGSHLTIYGGTTTFNNTASIAGAMTIDTETPGNATLIINNNAHTVTTANISLANKAQLFVQSGTLDTSNGTLTVNANASQFETGTNGTLIAKASDFGTFEEDGSFSKGSKIDMQLTNNGNLTLTGLTFNVPKVDAGVYENLLKSALLLTQDSSGTITFDGLDMSDTYSLTTVNTGYANGNLSAGVLGENLDGTRTNKTVSVSHIVATGSITDSTIEFGSELTITGKDASTPLTVGSITNNGTLNLGKADIEYISDFGGDLTTNASATTNINSMVNFTNTVETNGTMNVNAAATFGGTEINGTMNVNAAATFNGINTINGTLTLGVDGAEYVNNFYGNLITNAMSTTDVLSAININGTLIARGGTLTFDSAATIGSIQASGANTTFNSDTTINGAVDINSGSLTFNNGATIAGTLDVNGGTLNAGNATINNTVNVDRGALNIDNGATINGDVNINSGIFNLNSSTIDLSDVAFNVASGGILESESESTLLVGLGTIGSDDQGVINNTATVSGAITTDLLGYVTIEGFDVALEYGGTGSIYGDLRQAAQASFGNVAKIAFDGVRLDFSNSSVQDVIDNNDNTLSNQEIAFGTEQSLDIPANTNISVGAITGGENKQINIAGSGGMSLGSGNTDKDKVLFEGAVNNSGDVTLGSGTIGSITNNVGASTTVDGDVVAKEIKLEGDNTGKASLIVNNNSTLTLENLIGNDYGSVFVGDSASKGSLMVTGTTTLAGTMVFADPSWTGDISFENASAAVFANLNNGNIDGDLVAGRNSYIVIGDSNIDWAQKSFAGSNHTWGNESGNITAALFINEAHSLDSTHGGIVVNGALESAPSTAPTGNTATFAENSLLTINANNLTTDAALSSTAGTLVVDDTAQLVISGGSDEQVVTIVDGFNSALSGTGWGIADKANNLKTDSILMEIASTDATTAGKYTVTLNQLVSNNPYLNQSANNILTEVQGKYASDVNNANKGVAYLNRIVNTAYLGNQGERVQAQEMSSVFQLGSAGATNAVGLDVANSISGIIGDYNSMSGIASNGGVVVAMNENEQVSVVDTTAVDTTKGIGVWFMPVVEFSNVSGMKSGSFESGYDSTMFGGALGMDYSFASNLKVGGALSIGSGSTESNGDLNKTENDFFLWGLSAYGNYQMDNIGFSADLGYSGVSSEISQSTNSLMAWGNNTADASTNVFTLGAKAEYLIKTSMLDVIPHAGLRYTFASTGEYDVKGNGGTVANIASDSQHLFSIPLGVEVQKEFVTASAWKIAPKADIGLTATLGNNDATSKASVSGLSTSVTYEMENVDSFAFNGGLGVEVVKDAFSVDFKYDIQASSNEVSHGLKANFRYEF